MYRLLGEEKLYWREADAIEAARAAGHAGYAVRGRKTGIGFGIGDWSWTWRLI